MLLNQAKGHLQTLLRNKTPIMLWGPPGVGKSSIISQICQEWDWELIDLRLSLLNPIDLRGLPYIDKERGEAVWMKPEFLPNGHHKKQGILFLDEINTAPTSVQIAAYQLILDRRLGNYIFPEDWRIVAAGNRETDGASVTKMPSPLANRLIHVNVQASIEDWKIWARGNIRQEIISFLDFRPQQLSVVPKSDEKAFPSPRSWAFASKILDLYPDVDDCEEILNGTVGEGSTKEFVHFLTVYKEIPPVDKILSGEYKKAPDPKRPDVIYALIGALLTKLTDENLPNYLEYIRHIQPADFFASAIREAAKAGWDEKIKLQPIWKTLAKEIRPYL